MTDYARLAAQFGGQAAAPQAGSTPAPDVAALAQQFGGTPVAEPRSMVSDVGRQFGLTLRHAVNGLSYPGRMLGDLLQMDSTGALNRLLDHVGIPRAENATERVVGDITSGMAGVATGGGLGRLLSGTSNATAQGVGNLMQTGYGMQTAGAAAGATAAGATRESGGSPLAQMVAGLAGGVAPSLATAAAAAATRGAARGGEAGRLATADTLRKAEEQGIDLSAGQASGSRLLQTGESVAGKTLGGSGVMVEKGKGVAAQMGGRVQQLADDIAPATNATTAGRSIEKGLQLFTQRFKEQQGALYDKLDAYIDPANKIRVDNTRLALQELNADIPGAPALSELFKNSKIKSIQGALESDVAATGAYTPSQLAAAAKGAQRALDLDQALGAETLPYEAIKKLRTLVGNQITDASLASDVPRSKWKALYGALSGDLENAARQAGPQAEQAYARANTFTRAGHDRIEGFLDRVKDQGTYEKVFRSAVNPSEIKEGASTVNAIMRSLGPDERKNVTAAFVRRLGTATPGVQDETGQIFSPRTFLTQYASMNPGAKATLFGAHTGDLRKNLDTIAEIASKIDQGSKVLSNPPNTAASLFTLGQVGGMAGAVASGNFGTAALLLSGIPASYGAAKLFTNPDFVRWLARSTELSPTQAQSALAALQTIKKRQPDDVQQEIDAYVSRVSSRKDQ